MNQRMLYLLVGQLQKAIQLKLQESLLCHNYATKINVFAFCKMYKFFLLLSIVLSSRLRDTNLTVTTGKELTFHYLSLFFTLAMFMKQLSAVSVRDSIWHFFYSLFPLI